MRENVDISCFSSGLKGAECGPMYQFINCANTLLQPHGPFIGEAIELLSTTQNPTIGSDSNVTANL